MPTNVIMPALGLAQDVGRVLRWLKAEGETVTEGEPLLEIETDKTTVDLEAPATGVLTAVAATAGQEVPVGQVIAWILGEGEPPPPASAPEAPAPPGGSERRQEAAPGEPAQSGPGAPPPRAYASPKARRLARQLGVDLARVQGTGPGGAVLEADILRAGASASPAAAAPTAETSPTAEMPPAAETSPSAEMPLTDSPVWRLMAERTTRSWTTAPHFYLFREVLAGNLLALLAAMKASHGAFITLTDVLVHRVASTLRRHAFLNAVWSEEGIAPRSEINIGLAVAMDRGVVVPVIKGADALSVPQIARRRQEVVDRARAGRLTPDDVRGGTFTISNLGMYGIDAFLAILNTPQAAILTVGRVVDRVVAVDGRPAVQPTLVLALSGDHRLVDGARAARFLAHLADACEAQVPC